jgi:hypothetical protein
LPFSVIPRLFCHFGPSVIPALLSFRPFCHSGPSVISTAGRNLEHME